MIGAPTPGVSRSRKSTSPLYDSRIPEIALPVPRHVLLLLAVLCSATGLAPGASAEENGPTARADALHETYEKFLNHTDFTSFSRRMEAIRTLGTLEGPEARKHLLAIARTAKTIDDRVVAFTALGPKLDVAEAKALAGVASRKRDPLLTQALAQAFILASDEDVLTWLATDAFEIKAPSVLQAVLDAQSIHADPRARERLHAVFEKQREKRRGMALAYAALRAIGIIADPRDRTFLLRLPSNRFDWRLRLAGAETIARQKPVDINVRGAIVQYLNDDHALVNEAAAEGIGRAGIVELTDNLADLLRDDYLRTRQVAHAALREMHRKDLGWDPDTWKRWWKSRADVPKDIQQEPSSSTTTYYGVKVRSDRLLFIIDLSGSMAFPWGEPTAKTRIGVARRQLEKVIGDLDEKTLFNVIVFSDKVQPWRKNGEVLASEEAKADALAWIAKRFEKPQGGTFMHAALETAFEQNPNIDTIFLLTDGLATDGEPIVPEAILASVNRWNRFRRVVVHTFALTLEDLQPDGLQKTNLEQIKRFMRRLANLTGGECRIITKPPALPK